MRALIDDCLAGGQESWNRIVDRYTPLIWAIARGHRLSPADCEDVCQTTWMRVIQHLGKLRDPDKLANWISVSARRESLKHIQKAGRSTPTEDPEVFDRPQPPAGQPEERVLEKEARDEVLLAYCSLSPKCQALLGLLVTDPPMTYDEIGAALGMARGSIGPIRGRCLKHLQRALEREADRSQQARVLFASLKEAGLRAYALEGGAALRSSAAGGRGTAG
ncbi:sigma-70 family RNA polymerase sigma factor [Streptomyces pactum]|uniref:Sigma-70 family RNA polymerase sigma factor n=1 Tax=Streptomyces pactum TaxID=68249 RepID=A0ABS0NT90_9ACTN|nr:sigma-70 family RNA polymerase sigma factor [Streptomyces pactum]